MKRLFAAGKLFLFFAAVQKHLRRTEKGSAQHGKQGPFFGDVRDGRKNAFGAPRTRLGRRTTTVKQDNASGHEQQQEGRERRCAGETKVGTERYRQRNAAKPDPDPDEPGAGKDAQYARDGLFPQFHPHQRRDSSAPAATHKMATTVRRSRSGRYQAGNRAWVAKRQSWP